MHVISLMYHVGCTGDLSWVLLSVMYRVTRIGTGKLDQKYDGSNCNTMHTYCCCLYCHCELAVCC